MDKAYKVVDGRPLQNIYYLPAADRSGYTMHVMYTRVDLIRHAFVEPYTFSFKLNEVKEGMLDAGVEGVTTDFIAAKLMEIKAESGDNVFERRKAGTKAKTGTGAMVGMAREWDEFYDTYLLRLDVGKKGLYERLLQLYKSD